jgi:RNA polymerase sigma factor (sigma-70 family)
MRKTTDVTKHLEPLWRYARVLTRNDADADDLLQDALVRALSRASGFDPSRPLLPWLIRIVRNTFLTGVERAGAERRRREGYAELHEQAALPVQEHSAQLSQVRGAMDGLPSEQGEVLYLIGVLGFKYGEAAEVLNVPTGTIMSRLSRARSNLKQSLDQPVKKLKVVGGVDVK